MAKIKFGGFVTDMRGKVGSTVFSKNRAGAYARSYKTNVISNTPSQELVRARLANLSRSWRGLTQDARNAWNGAVENFKHTNIFGSMINPSGFDLYIKLNCNLLQVGVVQIGVPPLPGVVLNVKSLSITASSTGPSVVVNFDASGLSADYALVIMCTACISAGKMYVKNLIREVEVVAPSVAVPLNITGNYQAKFTSILAGMRISCSIVCVNKITGQKSIPISATCIVDGPTGLDYNQGLNTGIPLD